MRLFEPLFDEGRLHPNFRNVLNLGNGYILDVLNDWARGFADRDGKFVEEFQTTFNSGFWELYVHAVLKKFGMDIDFSHSRPDFCIPKQGLLIEATVALNAAETEPEHARLGKAVPSDLNEFNRRTIVRLCNSLTAKHRMYLDSYSALDHVKECAYVVAITNFDQPYSFLACQRPIEAVLLGYYVDEERFIASGGKEGKLVGKELLQVFKDNGSPVELGMFDTPAFKEISAVIFNGCANMGKLRALSDDPNPKIFFSALRLNPASTSPHVIRLPKPKYVENLVDGLRIYHNPFAVHPLDPAIFRHPSIFQSYWQKDDLVVEQREGLLLSRSVETVVRR